MKLRCAVVRGVVDNDDLRIGNARAVQAGETIARVIKLVENRHRKRDAVKRMCRRQFHFSTAIFGAEIFPARDHRPKPYFAVEADELFGRGKRKRGYGIFTRHIPIIVTRAADKFVVARGKIAMLGVIFKFVLEENQLRFPFRQIKTLQHVNFQALDVN